MPIKNKLYRDFLDGNNLLILNVNDIKKVINNIDQGLMTDTSRALVIVLYYTGCRPTEALELTPEDFLLEETKLTIKLTTKKKGQPYRYLEFNINSDLLRELYSFVKTMPPLMKIFHRFKGNYSEVRQTKKGPKVVIKHHQMITYYIKKWFKVLENGTIPPYYLRHNRFTSMLENGATIEQVMLMKGARSQNSVIHYLHSTKDIRGKIAKTIK